MLSYLVQALLALQVLYLALRFKQIVRLVSHFRTVVLRDLR